MPRVSVLLPCYNAAATLSETLDSLAKQTLTDFEVIAVDDGSVDATLRILQDWAVKDSRFRVFSRSHAGVIATANAGLELCQAAYIARMDADDYTHPERLTLQADFLDQNPDVAVVSSLVKAFPEKDVQEGYRIYVDWLNTLVTNEDICREIFVESPLANSSVMMQRTWVEMMGGYHDYGWPEDYDLFLRMYLAGALFEKIPKVLLEWRDHPGRITRTDEHYSVENFLRAKAHYLARGPLANRDAVMIWGAGMAGRKLVKLLESKNIPLACFIDVDPQKIGRTRRGLPVVATDHLLDWWKEFENPAILAVVRARGARQLIRSRLNGLGLIEGQDWWAAA